MYSSAAPALFYGCSTSLWQLRENRGRTKCPFSLSTIRGSEEMLLPLPVSPGMLLCGMHYCVAGVMRLLPIRKGYFLQQKKSLCFPLSESADFVTKKTKVEGTVNFRFSSMEKQIPIREIQIIQSCFFSLRGSHVCFSPLTAPCHIPWIQTLKQQCQCQSFLFHM